MVEIEAKDFYDTVWKSRDFEISHLWQRSIFLGTFLIFISTIYASLWSDVLKSDAEFWQIWVRETDIKNQFLFTIVSLLGLFFSVLWMQMAKGSKYWYERHEEAINYYIDDNEWISEKLKQKDKVNEIDSIMRMKMPDCYPRHGHLPDTSFNNSLFSNKGGRFSLSKINVAIGRVFLVSWFCFFWYHSFLLISNWLKCSWFLYGVIVFFIVRCYYHFTHKSREFAYEEFGYTCSCYTSRSIDAFYERKWFSDIIKEINTNNNQALKSLFRAIRADKKLSERDYLRVKKIIDKIARKGHCCIPFVDLLFSYHVLNKYRLIQNIFVWISHYLFIVNRKEYKKYFNNKAYNTIFDDYFKLSKNKSIDTKIIIDIPWEWIRKKTSLPFVSYKLISHKNGKVLFWVEYEIKEDFKNSYVLNFKKYDEFGKVVAMGAKQLALQQNL